MLARLASCLTLLALSVAPALHATEYTINVGSGSRGCDVATIGEAIATASSTAGDITTIRISGNATYSENLDLNNKNLRLIGTEPCGPFIGNWTRPILSGAGGARRSIININGPARNFTLKNLELRGGDELLDDASYGGALDISAGPHLVEIENVAFQQNVAGYGGAISVRGTAAPDGTAATSSIYLKDGVTLSGNRGAYGGGGLYCRNAHVFAQGINTAVFQNIAGGAVDSGETPPTGGAYGGGLLLDDCVVRIAAASFGAHAVALNEASGPGGGIAALGESTRVEIGNIAPDKPTRIANNRSDRFGGGIDLEFGAQAVLYDAIVEGNSARQGGGAIALFNTDQGRGTGPALHALIMTSDFTELAGRARCRSNIECNVIRDNEAYDGATPRPGAAFRISQEIALLEVHLRGTRISGNRGLNLFSHVGGSYGIAETSGSTRIRVNAGLIDNNAVTDHLIDLGADVDGEEGYNSLEMAATTLTDNSIGGAAVFRAQGRHTVPQPFGLARSIVHQPGTSLISIANGPVRPGWVRHVLASSLMGVPDETGPNGQPVNMEGSPFFVDAAHGNYFLRRGWYDIDFAPATGGDRTRDGGNRVVDVESDADRFGPQDLGAFETPAGPPQLSAPDLPDGRVGVPYQYTVFVANGQGGRLSFATTGLPAGLSIDRDSAMISGTPSTGSEGLHDVQIDVSNALGETTTVLSTLVVLDNSVVHGQCGLAHNHESLSAPADELCLAGTPSEVAGSGPWTWECSGANGGASAACAAQVSNHVFLTVGDFPDGTVGHEYQFHASAASYHQPVRFSGTGFPPGLVIDAATGNILGTPTQVGTFASVLISANNGVDIDTVTRVVTIRADAELAIFEDGFEDAP